MRQELLLRFVIGGTFVSLFALSSDILKPKSFAGLFGAAPSIALATLILTVFSKGAHYAAVETRSMIAGAVAFAVYAGCASYLMMNSRTTALVASSLLLPLWIAVAIAVWRLLETLS